MYVSQGDIEVRILAFLGVTVTSTQDPTFLSWIWVAGTLCMQARCWPDLPLAYVVVCIGSAQFPPGPSQSLNKHLSSGLCRKVNALQDGRSPKA